MKETLLEALSRALEAIRPKSSPADEILRCIEARCCDSELSLDSLGLQFHMTASNVSKLIKAKTGQSYIDYVSYLRVEEARRLLERTDLRIQEITQRVGYADAASFSRKFKAMQGESPADYRARVRTLRGD